MTVETNTCDNCGNDIDRATATYSVAWAVWRVFCNLFCQDEWMRKRRQVVPAPDVVEG